MHILSKEGKDLKDKKNLMALRTIKSDFIHKIIEIKFTKRNNYILNIDISKFEKNITKHSFIRSPFQFVATGARLLHLNIIIFFFIYYFKLA